MTKLPARDIEIREPSNRDKATLASLGREPEVQVSLAYPESNNSSVVTLAASELADLHRKVTLFLMSFEGKEFLRSAGVDYSVFPSQPERHPEWEACK